MKLGGEEGVYRIERIESRPRVQKFRCGGEKSRRGDSREGMTFDESGARRDRNKLGGEGTASRKFLSRR